MVDASAVKLRALNGLAKVIQKIANSRVPLHDIQRRYSVTGGQVIEIRVSDLDYKWYFRINDSQVEFVDKPTQIYGGCQMRSDTVFNLITRRRTYMDPATGRSWDQEYTPIDALKAGDVQMWGHGVSADFLLFSKALYKELWPIVGKELDRSGLSNGA